MMRACSGIAGMTAAVLVLTGCGGGSDAAPTRTSTAGPATELPATEVPDVLPAALRVIGPGSEVGVGQVFRLTVRIEGVANLGAYQLRPAFDAAQVELVQVSDTGYVASTGRVATCATDGAQPPAVATSFCVTTGDGPGPSGDGTLALIEMRAVAAGGTEVGVEAAATTPDGRDIPLSIAGADVVVR